MTLKHLLGAAAVAALLSNTAWAQAPATPAEAPKPALAAPTPPVATPDAAPAVTPPASSIVTPPATTPAPAAPVAAAPVAGALVAKGDIVETLKADGHFKTFIKALDAANMTGVLKTSKNLTVFAPTDAAFAALPSGELDRLMKSPAELQKLMTYHVINATVDSGKIKGAKGGVKTVAGPELVLDGSGAQLMANTADIVQSDVHATNGTVHVVNQVLMPSTAPTLAATTGTTTDAAATAPAPATPATPTAPAKPATTMPVTPPTDTPPTVPEAPPTPETPTPHG